MKNRFLRLTALLLTAALLCGCTASSSGKSLHEALSAYSQTEYPTTAPTGSIDNTAPAADYVAYADMVYVRPDLDALQAMLDAAAAEAQGRDTDTILDRVYDFYDGYDLFYTMYCLADIRYSGDLTDDSWAEEYAFCTESSSQVERMLEELYQALAGSPARRNLESEFFGRGFFESYDDGGFWDDTVMALSDRETELENRYYDLQDPDLELGSAAFYAHCADDMAQVLVDLIRVRQELAEYCGYDSYPEFASDSYYYRDYTQEDTQALLEQIRIQLVPLYRKYWGSVGSGKLVTDSQTLKYLRSTVEAIGGVPEEAFRLMTDAGLYDITYSPNKYNSSFEVYLDSYQEPFLFMNPEQTRMDYLTLAHEFGHFANDYASQGSTVGMDVSEFFSQGMEYLSLCYADEGSKLVMLKMVDSLSTYVEQGCFAEFEQRMYGLHGRDLSVEGLYRLYDEVAQNYGFDAPGYDRREFVTITHFFTNPLYIVSYIVSNDAAMQLYQLEQKQSGRGLALYCAQLDTTEDYFLAFLSAAKLESPFSPGRMEAVRASFEKALA